MADKVEKRGVKIFIDDKELKQSYFNLRKEYKKQLGILRKLEETHPDYNKKAAEVKILKQRYDELYNTQRNLISGTKGSFSIFGKFKGLLGGMAGAVSGVFAVGSAIAWGKQVYQNIDLLRSVKHEVKQLTGLRGRELNQVASTTKALADTFNKDVKDTIKTADAIAEHFDLNQKRSLDLLRRGLLEGADAGGDLYQQLKEYAPFMKSAKLSAEEFLALIIETQKNGIYDDKGVDAIKEGVLSLREGTKATKDAIKSLGIDVNQFYNDIESGNLTYFDALKRISKQIDLFGDKTTKTGTAVADIFRGAGQDAGDEFIANIHTMNLQLEKSIDQSDEYTQLKQREFKINEDLNQIWIQLTGTGSAINMLYLNLKSGLVSLLGTMAGVNTEVLEAKEAFNGQAEKVIDLNKNLKPLIAEYDNLKSKSKLSKDEQSRLKTVIEQIGGIVPTAITQFDKYGRALDISSDKAKTFIDQQKLLLKYRNSEVIKEETELLEDYNKELNRLNEELNNRDSNGDVVKREVIFSKTGMTVDIQDNALSAKAIEQKQKRIAELQNLITGVQTSLDEHTGDYLTKYLEKEDKKTQKTAEELENRKQLEIKASKFNLTFTEKTSDDQLRMMIGKKQDEINAKIKLDKENAKKSQKQKNKQLEDQRKKSASDLEKELADVKKAQREVVDAKLALMQDGYKKEITIEDTRHKRRISDLENQKKDLFGIEDKAVIESIKLYNKAIDTQIDAEKRLHDFKKKAVTQKYATKTLAETPKEKASGVDIFGFSLEHWQDSFSRLEEGENMLLGWAERTEVILQGVGRAWGLYYDYINNREAEQLRRFEKDTNKKKESLKDQLDKGLIEQENYDKQVEKLDKNLDKQRAITEYNRAKREKAMALFEITSQTAIGVMKAYALSPQTFGLPWSAVISALGLAQAGVVAAAPLPDKGFYYGGFTGTKGDYKDEFGTITGYVHENEYVVPTIELEDPTVNQYVQLIEAKRTGVIDSIEQNNTVQGQAELKALIANTNALLAYLVESGIDSRVIWGYSDTQELDKQQKKLNRVKNNG